MSACHFQIRESQRGRKKYQKEKKKKPEENNPYPQKNKGKNHI